MDRTNSFKSSSSQKLIIKHMLNFLCMFFCFDKKKEKNCPILYTDLAKEKSKNKIKKRKERRVLEFVMSRLTFPHRTEDVIGGVVCLELVPNELANELLLVNEQS